LQTAGEPYPFVLIDGGVSFFVCMFACMYLCPDRYTPETAEEAVASGNADIVSFGELLYFSRNLL